MNKGANILSVDIFRETISNLKKLLSEISSVNGELLNKIRSKYEETVEEESFSQMLLNKAIMEEERCYSEMMAVAAGLPETAIWYSAAVSAYNAAVIHRKRMEYRLKLAKDCVRIAIETKNKVALDIIYNSEQIQNTSEYHMRRLGATDEDIRTYLSRIQNLNLNENQKYDEKKEKEEIKYENIKLPMNNGKWSGEVGNSKWIPNSDYKPKLYNEDNLSWAEILSPYKVKNVSFKNGKPDFKKFAKSKEVKIDNFTTCRAKNFAAFDKKLAEVEGKKAKDIFDYRKSNNLTIHEVDMDGNMYLLPSIIHGNIPHSGGISEMKNKEGN